MNCLNFYTSQCKIIRLFDYILELFWILISTVTRIIKTKWDSSVPISLGLSYKIFTKGSYLGNMLPHYFNMIISHFTMKNGRCVLVHVWETHEFRKIVTKHPTRLIATWLRLINKTRSLKTNYIRYVSREICYKSYNHISSSRTKTREPLLAI